jgi:hypothetical protein
MVVPVKSHYPYVHAPGYTADQRYDKVVRALASASVCAAHNGDERAESRSKVKVKHSLVNLSVHRRDH